MDFKDFNAYDESDLNFSVSYYIVQYSTAIDSHDDNNVKDYERTYT